MFLFYIRCPGCLSFSLVLQGTPVTDPVLEKWDIRLIHRKYIHICALRFNSNSGVRLTVDIEFRFLRLYKSNVPQDQAKTIFKFKLNYL